MASAWIRRAARRANPLWYSLHAPAAHHSPSPTVMVSLVAASRAAPFTVLAGKHQAPPALRALTAPPARTFSAAALPPHEELGMPSLSPTMTQGNVAEWKKAEGEEVSAGDILCSIETDKATLDLESMEDGFLAKILAPNGAKDVQVGTPICVMVSEKSDVGAFASYVSASAPAAAPPTHAEPPAANPSAAPAATAKPAAPRAAVADGERVVASPLARRLAREAGLSLVGILGSGFEGRVVAVDVEHAKLNPPVTAGTDAAAAGGYPEWAFPNYTDVPVKMVQKITAQRLTESKQTVPHYYLTVDVQMDKLMATRAALNKGGEMAGVKLSVTDFIIKASAMALMAVPDVNASWMGDNVRKYHAADISIAVQTEHGLMVPIVKDADTKGLASISGDVKELAGRARENKLTPADYTGGTFTISNLGMFGVKQFSAIVNPPQACILAVGGSEKRVIPGKVEGTYEEGMFMCATISADHRVIDGAVAAKWLAAFKKYMEDPMTMLL